MGFAERAQADYTLGRYTRMEVEGNKLMLEWTKTTGSQGTMSLQFRYRVKLRKKGSSEWKEIGPSSDLYCNIIELTYGTTYQIEVISEAVYGTGGGSYGVREVTIGPDPNPIIKVSKKIILMGAEGGTVEFILTSNRGWDVSCEPSDAYEGSNRWISPSSSHYDGRGFTEDRTYTISISPNTSKTGRGAKVIFKSTADPSVQASISILQVGKIVPDTEAPKPGGYVDGYPKAISPTAIEVKWTPATDEGGTAQENLRYQVKCIRHSDGETVKTSPELTNQTEYTITGLEPETEYRIQITVWDEANNSEGYGDPIVKTPAAAPPIIKLSKNEITIEATTATERFTLTSNCGWERKFEPKEAAAYYSGWIELSAPESSVSTGKTENTEFTMMFAPNKSTTDRTAKIIFTSTEDPSVTATLTVKQKGEVAAEPKPEPKPEPGPGETVLVSSITLDQPKVSIDGDRKSFQLKASVLPANATNSELQWSSSNPSVASVEAVSMASLLKAGVTGKAVTVHIHKKGKAEITAQAMDGSGKSASCQVNVLSTVGNIEAAATRIYALGSTLRLTLPQAAVVRIYNVSGALVHMLNASAGDTSVALPAGVYVVRVGDTVQKVRIE